MRYFIPVVIQSFYIVLLIFRIFRNFFMALSCFVNPLRETANISLINRASLFDKKCVKTESVREYRYLFCSAGSHENLYCNSGFKVHKCVHPKNDLILKNQSLRGPTTRKKSSVLFATRRRKRDDADNSDSNKFDSDDFNPPIDPSQLEPKILDLQEENMTKFDRIARDSNERRQEEVEEMKGKQPLFYDTEDEDELDAEDEDEDYFANASVDEEVSKVRLRRKEEVKDSLNALNSLNIETENVSEIIKQEPWDKIWEDVEEKNEKERNEKSPTVSKKKKNLLEESFMWDENEDEYKVNDQKSKDDFDSIESSIEVKRTNGKSWNPVDAQWEEEEEKRGVDETKQKNGKRVIEISNNDTATFDSFEEEEEGEGEGERVAVGEGEGEGKEGLGGSEEEFENEFDLDFDNEFIGDGENFDFQQFRENISDTPIYRMKLNELLMSADVHPISINGMSNVEVTGIQIDSRQVSNGDLFVCIIGSQSNGHAFAKEAIEKGASAILACEHVEIGDVDELHATVVMIKDTNDVIARISDTFYDHPSQKMAVVGITGTNGKTTTSYLIKSIYESMQIRTGLLGTIEYRIADKQMEASYTTPDAVTVQSLMASMLHQECEACVMEVSSHALALDRCKCVDFDVAVFTNLTRDHLDFHKTEEEYRRCKGLLFKRMVDPERHRKVINIDDPSHQYFMDQGNPDVPVITYSLENENADVYPLEVSLSLFETELIIHTPKGTVEISSGLLGRHNVYNILAALCVGLCVDIPLERIVHGIEEVDAVAGRCELIDEEQTFAVVVDYAHTPDAVGRILDAIKECGPQRVITVIGCGGDRDKGKRPMMAKIATEKSQVTILTSDNPRTEDPLNILDDMLRGIGLSMESYLEYDKKGFVPTLPNGHRVFVHDMRGVALRAGIAMAEEGDAVVIVGKGHETYQIVGDEKIYFDDRDESREALQQVDDIKKYFDTSELPWRILDSSGMKRWLVEDDLPPRR